MYFDEINPLASSLTCKNVVVDDKHGKLIGVMYISIAISSDFVYAHVNTYNGTSNKI